MVWESVWEEEVRGFWWAVFFLVSFFVSHSLSLSIFFVILVGDGEQRLKGVSDRGKNSVARLCVRMREKMRSMPRYSR